MDAGWFSRQSAELCSPLAAPRGRRAALVFFGENGARRELSRDQLREEVAAIAAGLREAGVEQGDRVGGYLPNCPEAVIAMLATTSIGAIWSSCSPDFRHKWCRRSLWPDRAQSSVRGERLLLQRQDLRHAGDRRGHSQCGRQYPDDRRNPVCERRAGRTALDNAIDWTDFQSGGEPLSFTPVAFNHPLYIMYSSGTTGVPKCIVHGHGGTLLQHLKEHVLHTDIGADDRAVLLHYLRLDDVELAGQRAGDRGHAGLVRRLAVLQ